MLLLLLVLVQESLATVQFRPMVVAAMATEQCLVELPRVSLYAVVMHGLRLWL